MKTMKKVLAIVLSLALVISGIYFAKTEGSEAKAETTTGATVDDGMLNVKVQAGKNADASVKALRFVTSVNSLDYKEVGFVINWKENGEPKSITWPVQENKVYERIESIVTDSTDESYIGYKFSPKVVDTSSEYFATGKLNVTGKESIRYTVKAYVIPLNGTVDDAVYGASRCVSYDDAATTEYINMSFVSSTVPTTDSIATTYGTANTSTTATVIGSDENENGGYNIHVTVPADVKNLPSATKFTFSGYGDVVYRNLYTTHVVSGNTSINSDRTWYDAYADDDGTMSETEFVIATSADLYGLKDIVNGGTTLSGATIYLISDVTINALAEGEKAADWASDAPTYSWVPIGKSSSYSNYTYAFEGTFDGQGHDVKGLYANKSSASAITSTGDYFLGLFGWVRNASIQNVNVMDSYIVGTGKVGAVIGQGRNVSVENVYTNAYIDGGTSGDSIGGMAGLLNGGTLDGCTFEGTIKGKQNVGGMIGYFDVSGSISNCQNAGTITTTGQAIGGMVGYNPTSLDIDNCWFNGVITGAKYIGGMVGYSYYNSGTTYAEGTIQNCLSSGTLHATDQQVGGLLGHMNTGRTIELVNCLSVSTVTSYIAERHQATIIGYHNDGTLSIDSVYGYSDPSAAYGASEVSGGESNYVSATEQVGSATAVTLEEIAGTNAYVNTKLPFDDLITSENFDGVWVARQNKTPMLRSFANTSEIQSLFGTDTAVTADTSWYDVATGSESDPYVLSDAADLYGFAQKVNSGTTFASLYIVLDKNIIVNASDSSNWDEAAPVNTWAPIGNSGSATFNGNFNGNGYTISGLYGNLGTAGGNMGLFGFCGSGCKISNVNLKNSYFVYSGTTDSTTMGAIAVLGRGEITSVYCNATLESSGLGTGGIVGTKRSALTLTNCWFAGKIDTSGCAANSNQTWAGGLIGSTNGSSTTINHCFVTGTISTSVTSGTVRQGGFIGSAHGSGTVAVTDSLNVAVMTTAGATIRSLIGGMVNGTVELTNCYATDTNIDLCGSNVTTENCGVFGENSVLSTDYWVTVEGSTPILKAFQ